LWGPRAGQVLQAVCRSSAINQTIPYYRARQGSIGDIPALVVRISYVGELGWEIYVPTECALALWDRLWEAGKSCEMVAAGGGAFDSLRLEKGYRLWGSDIHTEYDPFEAGLTRSVRLDKPDFIGRTALIERHESGPARRLSCLTLDNDAAVLMGKEPLLHDDE